MKTTTEKDAIIQQILIPTLDCIWKITRKKLLNHAFLRVHWSCVTSLLKNIVQGTFKYILRIISRFVNKWEYFKIIAERSPSSLRIACSEDELHSFPLKKKRKAKEKKGENQGKSLNLHNQRKAFFFSTQELSIHPFAMLAVCPSCEPKLPNTLWTLVECLCIDVCTWV